MKKENFTVMPYLIQKLLAILLNKAYLVSGEGCLSVDEQYSRLCTKFARVTVKGY